MAASGLLRCSRYRPAGCPASGTTTTVWPAATVARQTGRLKASVSRRAQPGGAGWVDVRATDSAAGLGCSVASAAACAARVGSKVAKSPACLPACLPTGNYPAGRGVETQPHNQDTKLRCRIEDFVFARKQRQRNVLGRLARAQRESQPPDTNGCSCAPNRTAASGVIGLGTHLLAVRVNERIANDFARLNDA